MTGTGNENGDPENVPPSLEAVADQTVLRNTLNPPSLVIDLAIEDPDDDSFTVSVTSDNENVIPATEIACGSGACQLTLTPAVDETVDVTVTVVVADDGGGADETSFVVRVRPALVTTVDDDGAGSLRQTIADAEAGDVIGFDQDGVFGTPQTITLLEQLVLDKSLTVEGPGAGMLTVSGGDAVRVFRIADGAVVTLHALTIADGFAPVEEIQRFPGDDEVQSVPVGGGIFVEPASTLTLREATVTGSAANGALSLGGGVATYEGTLTVIDSDIAGNAATSGSGGGIGSLSGSVVIRNSVIESNSADLGGGVSGEGGTLLIDGSELSSNDAESMGGGMFKASGGQLNVIGATIAENSAPDGGGVWSDDETTIQQSTIMGNQAEEDGGGFYFTRSVAVIDASTIADNEANEAGGIFHARSFNSVLILTNGTQVTGNTAVVGGGLYHDSDGADLETRIENSTVRGNMATFGGGIFSIGGLLDIRGSSIDNNDAAQGGGIMAVQGDVSLSDDGVVLANRATGNGGGIVLGGTLTVTGTSCMILGNFADADEDGVGEGGGIFNDGGDISGVSMARVCDNVPDDIAEP